MNLIVGIIKQLICYNSISLLLLNSFIHSIDMHIYFEIVKKNLSFQGEVVDPRRSHQYCLKVHERRKKFLSKVSTTPYKLQLSSTEENIKTPFHRFVLFIPSFTGLQ
jgi:hypothetical protein